MRLALLSAYALWVQWRERAITRLIPRQIRPRLAASLLELADRFGEPTEGGVLVRVCLTHQMLADMAASSRVGISNEVARFQHESLIETRARGTIVVRNLRRLSDIARGK